MGLNKAAFQRKHLAILGQWPVTVVFGTNDEEFTGTRTQVALDKLNLDAGNLDNYDFSVQLSKHQFRKTTEPTVRDLVTIDGTKYRVLDRSEDGPAIAFLLHLGPEFSTSG